MSAAHTPGPWLTKHRKGADDMYRTEVYSEQHGGIATCDWTPKNSGNGVTSTYREANARLIAAAPELLDALDRLSAQCARMRLPGQPMSDAEKNAAEIISKATP